MKDFLWEPAARDDLRRIEQAQALWILRQLTQFAETGKGDLRKLVDDKLGRYRLRIGDWRILFRLEQDAIHIFSVVNRKDAYR